MTVYYALKARLEGRRFETTELTHAADSAEAAYMAAIYVAGKTRGLKFLPEKIRHPIHLRLVERHLKAADAPLEALLRVEKDLAEVHHGVLYDALFDPTTLSKVDLTPEEKGGDDYFTKYFQPVMVACSEKRFVLSAGTDEISEQQLLVDHMKLLSEGRVRSAIFSSNPPNLTAQFSTVLPQPLPTGFKKIQRTRVKQANKDAVGAVLFVIWDGGQEVAKGHEQAVEKHLQAIEESFCCWTCHVVAEHSPGCFLWQREPTH